MTRCKFCKTPMQRVYARYEPRDGRNVQAEVQFACKCGAKLTICDPQLRTRYEWEDKPRSTSTVNGDGKPA